jgi:phosphomannomutase
LATLHTLTPPSLPPFLHRYLAEGDFDEVHFFGDKTFEGGNDYEIFTHPRVIGHTVTSPEDTVKQLEELFFKK